MNLQTKSQVILIIWIHCINECNKAHLSKKPYLAKLQDMLAKRGIYHSKRTISMTLNGLQKMVQE